MRYPLLYQVNTRLWLKEITRDISHPATLDDIPESALQDLAEMGFQWLYLICMWKTGEKEAEIARAQAGLQQEAERLLGVHGDQAICSSCFAISGYDVAEAWGGLPALKRLRNRMAHYGLRLMLDFIPNHTGISHPWVKSRPDYYLSSNLDAGEMKDRSIILDTDYGPRILLHGRDPFFPPWIDTLQLNYANMDLQAAMIDELLKIAPYCDGLRCDMAMLILPEVFMRTWNKAINPFWPGALERVREFKPDFAFLAEAYWDMEEPLIQDGFDYAYDKQLYDHLKDRDASRIRSHIQHKFSLLPYLAHFLENHDEPRAAAIFQDASYYASALICYFLPGMRFFFAGQLEGYRERTPVQFCLPPKQIKDDVLSLFYTRMLQRLRETSYQENSFHLLAASPAWLGNETWRNILAFSWRSESEELWLLAVNFSNQESQCFLRIPHSELASYTLILEDVFQDQIYERPGEQMLDPGLYFERPAWGFHLFKLTTAGGPERMRPILY